MIVCPFLQLNVLEGSKSFTPLLEDGGYVHELYSVERELRSSCKGSYEPTPTRRFRCVAGTFGVMIVVTSYHAGLRPPGGGVGDIC